MPDDLTEQDVRLRREANALLTDGGLVALLAEYGTVHLSGSYALQLMTWRDLDIYMEAPDITVDEYFELGRRIYSLLTPRKMHFNDHRNNPLEDGIKGLYWGCIWEMKEKERGRLTYGPLIQLRVETD